MKLIIVSNRLPVTVEKKDGEFVYKHSVGGLVSGITDYLSMLNNQSIKKYKHLWIGFPGLSFDDKENEIISVKLFKDFLCSPVFFSRKVIDRFYHGFCNKTIWPLFHSFPTYVEYKDEYWKSYKDVNQIFAQNIIQILKPDDIVWIHDYHLMLLPNILRKDFPEIKIKFFLHIPFPGPEIFSLLPKKWRVEILRGLLGADLIGFHTFEYTQNFLQSVLSFVGFEHEMGKILTEKSLVKAGSYPIGINYQKFSKSIEKPEVINKINEYKLKIKNYRILLSIDRLDYTKGVINRLEGYELFLKENPQYLKKVVLIMIIVPSRVGVDYYQRAKKQIDEMVGRINGEYGELNWIPILYQTRFFDIDELSALYNLADVMLVTPLKDGMNLIAKEYIASRTKGTGVLILSEMAGASKELTEAILINPNDISELSYSIKDALEMPTDEQIKRNNLMQKRLNNYDIKKWGDDMMKDLISIKKEQEKYSIKLLTYPNWNKILEKYRKSNRRLFLLDYDGTLMPFFNTPLNAKPDIELLNLLKKIIENKRNEIVIISGRNKETLLSWFSSVRINLIAEHGIWIKEKEKHIWEMINPLKGEWKEQVLPIIQTYSDRLPGSFIEEKDYSIVLHYRQSNPNQASIILKEAVDYLINFTANLDLQVIHGNKIIEIRCGGVNKGVAAINWLSKNNYDFILSIGDDLTDEDLFNSLPIESVTIKVGLQQSYAKYNLYDYLEVRKLLKYLVENESKSE